MTYSLINKCAKNYYNRTFIVQVIAKNVVTCFFLRHSVDTALNQWISEYADYHSRQCGIVLKPRSDGIDYLTPSFALWRTTAAKNCESTTGVSRMWFNKFSDNDTFNLLWGSLERAMIWQTPSPHFSLDMRSPSHRWSFFHIWNVFVIHQVILFETGNYIT